MIQNQVALVVHTCDRYALLYPGFAYFFRQNWDPGIAFNLYIATEEIDANLEGFKNIKSGKGEWTDRLLKVLDQIDEEYLLYFQEDMWLNKPVSKTFFDELAVQAVRDNWKQVKLNSSEVFKTEKTGQFIQGFNVAQINNRESKYLMSHQVTLWNKQFLKEQLLPNENPWRNERRGTARLKKLNPVIYHIDYFAENGYPAINENAAGIVRGEYKAVSSNASLNNSAEPFIEELESDANCKEYAGILRQHFSEGLTHDGKEKPLKQDIFKRGKEWLKKLVRSIPT
jgi:hypothetical protein